MSKRLVLIIDDDPDDRLLMRRAIEQTTKNIFVIEAKMLRKLLNGSGKTVN